MTSSMMTVGVPFAPYRLWLDMLEQAIRHAEET